MGNRIIRLFGVKSSGILLIIILTFFSTSLATTYYVDSNNGNDNNNGTSQQTAWRTLSKVNSYNFQPGDIVELIRGGIWRESLTLSSSSNGNEGNYIEVTAYGVGKKPQINGADAITSSWTDQGSNVWSTTVSATVGSDEVWFGKTDTTHWGYKQSSASGCTQDYEWYQSGNTFYVYAQSNPATYYQWIQYAMRGSEITKQYIWLDNLDFAYGGKSGGNDFNLRTDNAHYMRITSCEFRYSGADNIYFLSSYLSMSNTKVYESAIHGIYCGAYSPYITKNDTIQNCTFWNNYYNNVDLMNVNQSNNNAGGHVVRFNKLMGRIGDYFTNAGSTPANVSVIGKVEGTSVLRNIKIYDNIITGAPVAGVLLSDYDDSIYIYNNTFDGNRHGITRNYFSGENGHYFVYNNIFSNSTYYGTEISNGEDLSNWLMNYNLFYNNPSGIGTVNNHSYSTISSWNGATGFDSDSYQSNPNYTNRSNYDYTIQLPSDAIDNGTNLGNLYNVDILQVSRPQGNGWDMAAYEYTIGGGGGGNNPPNPPTNPNPANGAVNQPANLTFTWTCTDPNGDPLTYDVYFGTSNNPPVVSNNQTSTSFNPGQLNNNTTYYWKIVATDNHSASTSGPLWNFTTINQDVTTPEVLSATLVDSVKLKIFFSEALDSATAQNASNYSITNNINIFSASLTDSIVTLTTSAHTPGTYTVHVVNVKDLAGNIITPPHDTANYDYILNSDQVTVQVKVYLEGPYSGNNMATDLYNNSLIPLTQPYSQSPWNYSGSESVDSIPQNTVDWILIELRTGTGASTVIARQAAFLRDDGIVTDLNGQPQVSFPGVAAGSYYIVVCHRNHLAIMTNNAVPLSDSTSLYNFTTSEDKTFGDMAMKSLGGGRFGMYAADGNSNGSVNNADCNAVWKKENGTLGYEPGDFDLNGGVNITDRNGKWKPNNGRVSRVPN
jgi:hypothetical protein